ncbi:MAG TPA: DMT family transporter [Hyphomicrobiaceae bacterium]|nr:DMT family transporter [Hyphomicrobiaceae bacterium]
MSATTLPAPTHRQMSGYDWFLLAICAVCWGSAYTFNKISITELQPFSITVSRLVIALTILWGMIALARLPVPMAPALWAQFFGYALLSNVVPFWLVLYGQRETASGLAAVIGATSPIFTLVLMWALRKDPTLDWRKLLAILTGVAGVAIVFAPAVTEGWGKGAEGKAALLLASLLYAFGAIYARRFVHLDVRLIAAMQMTAGLLITVPLTVLIERPWEQGWPSWPVVAAVVFTALFGTVVASLTFFTIMRRQGPTNTMLVTLLVPVTPLILGALWFGEALSGREFAGACVIALSLVIVDGRVFRWLAGAGNGRDGERG